MSEEITPIIITIESSALEAALDRLARAARDLHPAMRDIGGLLEKLKRIMDDYRPKGG